MKVSSASYNGQPCTLVSGDLYVKAQKTVSSTAFKGTSSACISTQYDTWLNQSVIGTVSVDSSGRIINATMNYGEHEIAIGGPTSAAITALPGPVVSS